MLVGRIFKNHCRPLHNNTIGNKPQLLIEIWIPTCRHRLTSNVFNNFTNIYNSFTKNTRLNVLLRCYLRLQ